MKHLINLLIATGFALVMASSAWAEAPDTASSSATVRAPVVMAPLQACPTDGLLNLSQISQSDCCKGHKGVCGCRAGKIVCCDNTASPDCTCHGDSGVVN